MRRLSPEPISEEDLRYVLDAATMAPNGENRQRWSFLVVTDPELKRRIGKIYAEAGRWGIGGGLESGQLDMVEQAPLPDPLKHLHARDVFMDVRKAHEEQRKRE